MSLKRYFYFSRVFLTHTGNQKKLACSWNTVTFEMPFFVTAAGSHLAEPSLSMASSIPKAKGVRFLKRSLFSSPSLSETVLKTWFLHNVSKLPPWLSYFSVCSHHIPHILHVGIKMLYDFFL